MPFKKQLADVELAIGETLAEISRQRGIGANQKSRASGAETGKLLAALARLRAERLRLMTRQRRTSA